MEKLESHLAAVHISQHSIRLLNIIISITSLKHLDSNIFPYADLHKSIKFNMKENRSFLKDCGKPINDYRLFEPSATDV